jgi:hypothetical protein
LESAREADRADELEVGFRSARVADREEGIGADI